MVAHARSGTAWPYVCATVAMLALAHVSSAVLMPHPTSMKPVAAGTHNAVVNLVRALTAGDCATVDSMLADEFEFTEPASATTYNQ